MDKQYHVNKDQAKAVTSSFFPFLIKRHHQTAHSQGFFSPITDWKVVCTSHCSAKRYIWTQPKASFSKERTEKTEDFSDNFYVARRPMFYLIKMSFLQQLHGGGLALSCVNNDQQWGLLWLHPSYHPAYAGRWGWMAAQ